MLVELHARSDVGRVRRGNEDNFLLLDLTTPRTWSGSDGPVGPSEMNQFPLGEQGLVLVVSDGMGGALAGDVASRMAIEAVHDVLMGTNVDGAGCVPGAPLVDCLKEATMQANRNIHYKSLEDSRCSGMGATLTGAAIKGDKLDLVQVGDSRAYVMRGDQIRLATKDQSLVQQLVDVGQISEEEAETHMFRNVILQALGAQTELAPATARIQIRQGDMLLLCSDGLSGKLRNEDIRQIVAENNGDLAAACDALVDQANYRGGEDNITVVLAKFTGEELREANADRITVELPPLEEDKTLDETEADTSTR
ncbi:MAG: family protein phosphatase [Blastocatellia bacterium]|nr:family protein phosphatase [Blastocatellia bacterium]MDX6305288.1 family protein phosphatase [Blastocatellia bacterium]